MTLADAVLYARAAAWLVAARAGLRAAPGPTLRWLQPPLGRRASRRTATDVLEAVNRVADAIGGACLARSVAARHLLAREGVAADVVIGAVKHDGRLHAHAWLESDDLTLDARDRESFLPIWRSPSLPT
jgi:hypothetical protein